jgi:hypothetical protein
MMKRVVLTVMGSLIGVVLIRYVLMAILDLSAITLSSLAHLTIASSAQAWPGGGVVGYVFGHNAFDGAEFLVDFLFMLIAAAIKTIIPPTTSLLGARRGMSARTVLLGALLNFAIMAVIAFVVGFLKLLARGRLLAAIAKAPVVTPVALMALLVGAVVLLVLVRSNGGWLQRGTHFVRFVLAAGQLCLGAFVAQSLGLGVAVSSITLVICVGAAFLLDWVSAKMAYVEAGR